MISEDKINIVCLFFSENDNKKMFAKNMKIMYLFVVGHLYYYLIVFHKRQYAMKHLKKLLLEFKCTQRYFAHFNVHHSYNRVRYMTSMSCTCYM